MLNFEYDSTENSLALRMKRQEENHNEKFFEIKCDDFSCCNEKEEGQCGIKILNVYNAKKLSGIKAEEEFKKMLDDKGVASLYVGQSPVGVEKSEFLLKDVEAKRPDFLVNLNGLGNIFVDVKFRNRNDVGYFYIDSEEIKKLYNVEEYFHLPVWIAFTDENNKFSFCRISKLFDFQQKLEKENPGSCLFTRVPECLLKKDFFEEDNVENFNNEIDECVKRSKMLEDTVKQRIKKIANEGNLCKTHAIEKIANELTKKICEKEVKYITDKLIAENIISYEPRKPLCLVSN